MLDTGTGNVAGSSSDGANDDPVNDPVEAFDGPSSDTHDPGPSGKARMSSRTRNPPTEWWNATALLALSPKYKLRFNAATKGEESSK